MLQTDIEQHILKHYLCRIGCKSTKIGEYNQIQLSALVKCSISDVTLHPDIRLLIITIREFLVIFLQSMCVTHSIRRLCYKFTIRVVRFTVDGNNLNLPWKNRPVKSEQKKLVAFKLSHHGC